MRSNLILSILLTTVIASPVVRRSQNANELIDLNAKVAGNNGKGESELLLPLVVDDGKGKSESGLDLDGDNVVDNIKLNEITKLIDIFKKKKGVTKNIEVDDFIKFIKRKIELENLSSVKKGDILAILEEYVGIDVKPPVLKGEEIKVGRDTPEAKMKEETEAKAEAQD